MNTVSPPADPKPIGLVTFMHELIGRDDRGALALIRSGLSTSENHQTRAWRILAPFGGIPEGNGHRAQVVRTVAGLMSLPKLGTAATGKDFGNSCRRLLSDDERKSLHNADQPGPVSRRMQHLLAASRDEVCGRVSAIARRLSNADGDVDFDRLYRDLDNWGQAAKARWAASFWIGSDEEATGEETK
jgi:CRISPR type I-E-associated protein CasB/Cse2